jgi:hypothetical protein
MPERWTTKDSARELRLAGTALRQAIEVARQAAEMSGLDFLPIDEEAGARRLAHWLDERAREFEEEDDG